MMTVKLEDSAIDRFLPAECIRPMIEDRDYMREPSPTGSTRAWPRMTVLHAIIIANVIAFFVAPGLVTALNPETGAQPSVEMVGQYAGLSLSGLAAGRFWTPLTHMFIHPDPLHLLGNLVLIYLAGTRLIALLGNRQFMLIYFVGGLVGGALQLAIQTYFLKDTLPMVGASACACAIGCALAAILPQENATSMIYFIAPVNLRLWTLAMWILGFELLLGLTSIISETASHWWGHNAYFAHIGGALFGWYTVRLLGYGGTPMTYSRLWHQQEPGRSPTVRRPQPRAVARMRRLKAAAPEMDFDAIRRKKEIPGRSDLSSIDEVDAILEKIHREGMSSLSEAERRLLESASRDLSQRDSVPKKGRR